MTGRVSGGMTGRVAVGVTGRVAGRASTRTGDRGQYTRRIVSRWKGHASNCIRDQKGRGQSQRQHRETRHDVQEIKQEKGVVSREIAVVETM